MLLLFFKDLVHQVWAAMHHKVHQWVIHHKESQAWLTQLKVLQATVTHSNNNNIPKDINNSQVSIHHNNNNIHRVILCLKVNYHQVIIPQELSQELSLNSHTHPGNTHKDTPIHQATDER